MPAGGERYRMTKAAGETISPYGPNQRVPRADEDIGPYGPKQRDIIA